MKSDEVLVIRCDAFLPESQLEKLHDEIVEDRKTGVIVLPAYCKPLIVPEDVKIKVRDGKDGTV